MKLKVRLSLVVIALIAGIIAILSIITLGRSNALVTGAAFEYAQQTAHAHALELGGGLGSYVNMVKTVANIFGEYYIIPRDKRRDNFDDTLWSLMSQNPDFMGLWTAWLPSALDGMDGQYGPYISAFTRRSGTVARMPGGFENWEGLLSSALKNPGSAIIANPQWHVVNNVETPVISIVYPVIDGQTKNAVGVVGVSYVTNLQNIIDEVGKELYNEKGYAGVYTNDGLTVAHFDQGRVQGYIYDNPKEQALLGGSMGAVLDSIKNGGINGGKPLTLTAYSATLETQVFTIYYPVRITDTATPWCMVINIPVNEVTKDVRSLTVFIIIFAIIALLVSMIITFIIASQIVKPVLAISRTLKDISEGEGDLTKTIEEHGRDETSDMAHYFNLTLEKIKKMVISIKGRSAALFEIGNELASNMTETATAVNEITANIQSIKGKAVDQSASVTETNAAMEQITANINKLNGQVEKQTASVAQSSSAIEEMLANIQSVTNTLIKNADNVEKLIAASEVGRAGLQEVAADIQEIARESEGILEINSVMEAIASQTNLLSMNAAIEAAHAGEVGKGFAVVADEIRKLAENSSGQSKTISAVLKKIKESIDKIINSTGNVLNEFEAIDSGIKTVSRQEENIRSAMEEQTAGSKQILKAVGDLNEITQQVKGGSERMLGGSKEVIREGESLEQVTQEISGGMNEMAGGADKINAAVGSVNDLSGQNRKNIELLVQEVSKFKVE